MAPFAVGEWRFPRTPGELRRDAWQALSFPSLASTTGATLAFFIMGSAVLHNEGRDPDGMRMVSTLATALSSLRLRGTASM